MISSTAAKIGCTGETLVPRGGEPTNGGPAAIVAQDRDRLKLLEREVKELRRANQIQRKASAYFARAELEGAR